MIDQTSNASRLVDKLVQKGLVIRKECPEDRRQVEITLTDLGMTELQKASIAMEGELRQHLSHLTLEEAIQLNGLLDKIRV
jgi:DNA-binding MarR family transcriptional regulator